MSSRLIQLVLVAFVFSLQVACAEEVLVIVDINNFATERHKDGIAEAKNTIAKGRLGYIDQVGVDLFDTEKQRKEMDRKVGFRKKIMAKNDIDVKVAYQGCPIKN